MTRSVVAAFALGLACAVAPDPQAIPPGTGWWCPEPQPNNPPDLTGGWCGRSENACKAELTLDVPCIAAEEAYCFTFVSYASGGPDSICLATLQQCQATAVHGRDYGSRISSCVETP